MKFPSLTQNVLAMGSVQAANYLLPLVTLPYLTRTLGLEQFGALALAYIILQYFVILTDWGFSWSVTQQVSVVRADHEKVSKIFAATWLAQWFLVVVSALILLVLIVTIPILNRNMMLYVIGFSLVVGNVLLPIWLLQGLECLKPAAFAQVTARIIAIPLTFILVDNSTDIYWAMGVTGFTSIFAGVLIQLWMWRLGVVIWLRPQQKDVQQALTTGSRLFFSKTWISLYTTLTPIVLGVIAGSSAVGLYNLADKLKTAAQALLIPLSQALFPRMSHLYQSDRQAAYHLLKYSGSLIIALSTIASFLLFFMADWLVYLFGGRDFAMAAILLKWLSPLPLIVSLSNLLGVQIMIANNMQRPFSVILAVSGSLSVCLMWPLMARFFAEGAAMNTLITEAFVTLAMAYYLFHKNNRKKWC